MKVAQYEVLGSVRKNDPSRTGRSTAGHVHQVACEKSVAKDSIVPGGTDISFCIIPSTSYWATFIGSSPFRPLAFRLRRFVCKVPSKVGPTADKPGLLPP